MSTTTKAETAIEALARFVGLYSDDLIDRGHGELECSNGSEFLVLSDEEANERCKEEISESVWAFNADFILRYTELPDVAIHMIEAFQQSHCEDANSTLKALIKDFDFFVDEAIAADGRGHFLASYDGEEHEVDGWFIYRIN